jgi:hypothetical protein
MPGPQSSFSKARVEAFSDGVMAVIITIMVLDLRAPKSSDPGALVALWPSFAIYLVSFLLSKSSAARGCSAMPGESGSWSWWSRRIEGLVVLRGDWRFPRRNRWALDVISIADGEVPVCLRQLAVSGRDPN